MVNGSASIVGEAGGYGLRTMAAVGAVVVGSVVMWAIRGWVNAKRREDEHGGRFLRRRPTTRGSSPSRICRRCIITRSKSMRLGTAIIRPIRDSEAETSIRVGKGEMSYARR